MPTHRDIVRISVHSEWVGFASPSWWAEDAEIVQRGDRLEFVSLARRNNIDGLLKRHHAEPFPGPLSPEAVDRLSCALERPPLGRPTLENLGLDGESMREEARRLLASPGYDASDLRRLRQAGNSDDWIVERLTEPQSLQAGLEAHFQGGWTDDHPRMSIRLGLAGGEGREITLESNSQMPHMLPWRIRMPGEGETFDTFDVEVPLALAACLPEGFLNHPRLLDQDLIVGPLPSGLVRARLCDLGSQYARFKWLRRLLDRGLHWIISSSIRPQ